MSAGKTKKASDVEIQGRHYRIQASVPPSRLSITISNSEHPTPLEKLRPGPATGGDAAARAWFSLAYQSSHLSLSCVVARCPSVVSGNGQCQDATYPEEVRAWIRSEDLKTQRRAVQRLEEALAKQRRKGADDPSNGRGGTRVTVA
ncbi:hypothetical protein HPB52_015030 [Rhipicephalus sanguineus]|uniref:Uncharacterized protein n=1 Tax=Rhipicephalus sanguineus TaxID=34632 RepID=A0A9D4SZD4_RHISA|nr:hypothetical protein HPB52_015030 [Rhipicephalus sanguineus]